MPYFKKVIGKRCYLSPIDPADVEKYTAWLNDLEVARSLNVAPLSISLPAEREALDKLARGQVYGIILLEGDRLIGNCGFVALDHLNRTGEIGIFIGTKEYWGRGYGEEALRLLLGYGFDYLNLRSVMLQVYSFNERAIACYRKAGFRELGRRRKALLREGAEHDLVYMDILDEEFRAGS